MCQAKPGNRCSPHAKERLTKTAQRVQRILDESSVTHPDYLTPEKREKYNEVRQELTVASRNYDATVAGLKELNERIVDYRNRGQDEMVEKLTQRKMQAKRLREVRKEAYSAAESWKITAKRKADREHDTDEQEMRQRIDSELNTLPRNSDQYRTREREIVNNLYSLTSDSLTSAKTSIDKTRHDLSKKVDQGGNYTTLKEQFSSSYENFFRTENRKNSLKQMKMKIDAGMSRYGE